MVFSELDLSDKVYWHITSKNRSTVLWNASLSAGWITTVSMIRQMPGLEKACATHDVLPKLGSSMEDVWEKVRIALFPHVLPRDGAMFVFDQLAAAQASAESWYPGQEITVVQARVHKKSRVHRGHLGWFEEPQTEWLEAAKKYWSGQENPRPPGHWESVVHGVLHFPEWKLPPFGTY